MHPSCATFLATKLVRHFVTDEPPAALVRGGRRAVPRHGRRPARDGPGAVRPSAGLVARPPPQVQAPGGAGVSAHRAGRCPCWRSSRWPARCRRWGSRWPVHRPRRAGRTAPRTGSRPMRCSSACSGPSALRDAGPPARCPHAGARGLRRGPGRQHPPADRTRCQWRAGAHAVAGEPGVPEEVMRAEESRDPMAAAAHCAGWAAARWRACCRPGSRWPRRRQHLAGPSAAGGRDAAWRAGRSGGRAGTGRPGLVQPAPVLPSPAAAGAPPRPGSR
jgi:hypothetical protein